MNVKSSTASGITPLIQKVDGFSQAQAAWRFYNNDNVTIPDLQDPIVEMGFQRITEVCVQYVPLVHDWSWNSYRHHEASKQDLITRSKKGGARQVGYELWSTLALSDQDGSPIAPLVQNLLTASHLHSTYAKDLTPDISHLEELQQRTDWLRPRIAPHLTPVHLIDREGDSIALMRQFHASGDAFVIRGKENARVVALQEEEERSVKIKELAKGLPLGECVGSILYKNKSAFLHVTECSIRIDRDAHQKITKEDGTQGIEKIPGEPLNLRLIVSRVVNHKGEVLATWLLHSNLPSTVLASTIATWYYWRWRIESYFKLLKTSSFQMESWQQERSMAIFRRLLIVSHACVLVWKIAAAEGEQATRLRRLLCQLSGRLIEKGKEFTYPALLAGVWSFFSILDVLELYSMDELEEMRSLLHGIMGIGDHRHVRQVGVGDV